MKSSSETGHAKNVANFEKLISYARELGVVYRPSNENLSIPALEELLAKARQSLDKTVQVKLKHDDAVIFRTNCFSDLNKLSSRMINYLISGDVPAAKVEDARAFSRKLSGRRAKGIVPEPVADGAPAETPRTVSVSQQSFDSRADFFKKLTTLVSEEKAYQPQEPDLTRESLNLKLKTLYECNQKAVQTAQLQRMALDERDAVLYNAVPCLFDCAGSAKAYLKAIAGVGSPVYKSVGKLKFIRPKK
jgi:hypothetical protein